MHMGVGVSCDDAVVGRWLEGWVVSLQLVPPRSVAMVVRVGHLPPAAGDAREPYRQPQLEIRSGPPQGDVRVAWLAGPARAVIAPGSRTAEVEIGPEALADRERLAQSFLAAVLILLLRRAGWHHVHAAIARDPGGRDWLFAGDAQSGKSTTAALLATWGWAVGSDDITFLARNGSSVEAVAQRAPIALRPEGLDLLGLSGGTAVRGGRKTAFFPEELGGTWAARVAPDVLVLPRVEGEATRADPVRAPEALVELVRWSAWVALEPALAQEHLDLLTALARQTRCYRLALASDLFARRDLLMELVP
jgi:hypothetical protein